jgi:hypothetical protein
MTLAACALMFVVIICGKPCLNTYLRWRSRNEEARYLIAHASDGAAAALYEDDCRLQEMKR